MGDCYTPVALQNFVSKDVNRIVGDIIKAAARRSPYMDVLDVGTIDNQMGAQFRAVVQNRTKVAGSLTIPVFTPANQICRTRGGTDVTGTQEYTYLEGILRGQSEEVCVTQAKQAFRRSWITTSASVKDGMIKLKDADIRGQLFIRSGVKAVVVDGLAFESSVVGDQSDIDTAFPSYVPNAFLTYKFVKRLTNMMNDDLMLDPFESENGTFAKLIGSRDLVDRLRDEVDFKADLRAFTAGKYTFGEKGLNSYEFDGPYKGVGFAVDPRPLRADVGGGAADVPGLAGYQLIEPEIMVETTNGFRAATNPAWSLGKWEFASLHFANSFLYRAGKAFAGEGDVQFPNALAPTTLEFVNIRDNDCNIYGDMGRFIYQIDRGFEPQLPHAVAFIMYRRCNQDLDLSGCNSAGNLI